ncbi:hypothetical protein [Runella aurantiaca]|uniref:Uncharacterized protein n=1 Tax=Runella aurantiaca TaxID=2282308 RepID=A0A369I961_9BACT|nr:hypothetical protein [Runella aurantiaca]RDB05612.1 hypothetical protein DVG78_13630 [Runella aurantiaca]
MSTLQPLPTSLLNDGNLKALNKLLSELEPTLMTDMLKQFFRGWLASTYVEEKEANERADLYFTFERMLAFTEALQEDLPKNTAVHG